MTAEELDSIRSLVGEVSREQLRYVECFVGGRMALFVPAVGPCFYAVTPDGIFRLQYAENPGAFPYSSRISRASSILRVL